MADSFRLSRIPSILLFGSGLLLSSLACSSFSSLASTATKTSAPQNTPIVTPAITEITSYLDWPVVFSDSFDEDTNGWPTDTADGEYAALEPSITGGKYLVVMTAKKSAFWWFHPDLGDLDDFFVSVTAEKVSGTADAEYGLVFRLGEDYYSFGITKETQKYSVYLWFDEKWEDVLDRTFSELIDPKGPNRLAVLAQGSDFTLFINGEEVDTFQDDSLSSGEVGVGINLNKTGDTVRLKFDDFEVKAPREPR
jgi:hypothetical protein